MNAQPPELDLTLLLPPDLAWAVDTAARAVREPGTKNPPSTAAMLQIGPHPVLDCIKLKMSESGNDPDGFAPGRKPDVGRRKPDRIRAAV